MADEPDTPPPSFNQQIASLAVGGTVAIAKRILRDSPEAGDIASVKIKMRASVSPAVSKARKRYGYELITDTGEFICRDGHVMVVISVTRSE